jgi:predicted nucleic acid-binding protein
MILLDTSVLIPCLRRNGKTKLEVLITLIAGADYFVPHFVELELLQGARDDGEWDKLSRFLADQELLQPSPSSWSQAARMRFDMARIGLTVQSAVDCCIAQMAIERGLTLVHQDRDYELIARVRPLTHHFLDLSTAP